MEFITPGMNNLVPGGPGKFTLMVYLGWVASGQLHGVRNCASNACCACVMHACARHWHWHAALAECSHYCFSLCGRPSIVSQGWRRRACEAIGKCA